MKIIKSLLPSNRKSSNGFTMMEVLLIVAILSLLVISLFITLRKQRLKADDATVKDDLNRIKIAFEEYYNDNNCYPDPAWLNNCGGNDLQPYLTSIPCQPGNIPYVMEVDEPNGCGWFKIYANLHDSNDPSVTELYVTDGTGKVGFNYGVSSSNTIITINAPESIQTYCQSVQTGSSGNCTSVPVGQTCSPFYNDGNCGGTSCDTNQGGQLGTCN